MVSSPKRLSVRGGTLLFNEGDAAEAAYLILSGTVELFRLDNGASRSLALRKTDDLFGEAALVRETARRFSAVATSDCDLLLITRDQVSTRIEAVDPLLRFCLSALLERLGEAEDPIEVHGARAAADPAPTIWGRHATAARSLLTFEHELRNGLDRDELDLHFQPIVGLASRRLAGFEGLVRWQHPERGLLQPSDFIPIAEQSGVISEITTFCLKKVAASFPALKQAGLRNPEIDPLFLSVNVSGLDLLQSSFAADSVSILCDGGVDPEDIRLEITESILMADAERCAETLQCCRDQGFKIAIDDFGTGYSSLHYLNMLPVSVLKMDKSFTLSLLEGAAGRKIIGAILQLGRELGLSVIAEGIENETQAAMLQGMGCSYGQGYLFGHALDRDATLRTIEGWRSLPHQPRRQSAVPA